MTNGKPMRFKVLIEKNIRYTEYEITQPYMSVKTFK